MIEIAEPLPQKQEPKVLKIVKETNHNLILSDGNTQMIFKTY